MKGRMKGKMSAAYKPNGDLSLFKYIKNVPTFSTLTVVFDVVGNVRHQNRRMVQTNQKRKNLIQNYVKKKEILK